MRKLIVLLFLLIPALGIPAEPLKLEKGILIESVPSPSQPGFTHALYLPSAYTPERKWPILYCFDARKRGKVPVEVFQEAAERFGYIVLSSNNSRSDDPAAPNQQAMNAMWNDSHRWFSIDEKRAYVTGFSGGARVAWAMGHIFKGSVAGVIGAGAGTHENAPPGKDTPFVFFGMIGRTDFNYRELRVLDQALSAAGIPSRIANFDGGHQWAPAATGTAAIEWMELQAMKKGLRIKDDAWIGQVRDQRLAQARELEQSSTNLFDAYLVYLHTMEDLEGLTVTADFRSKVAELQAMNVVRDRLDLQKKIDRIEGEELARYIQILGSFRNSSGNIAAAKIRSELKIGHYLDLAKKQPGSEEALMSQRILETAYVQTNFYLPSYFIQQKDFPKAITSISIAAEIHGDQPWPWYNLACAYAQKGDKKKAIEALGTAAQKGLKNADQVDADPDLAAIRQEEGYRAIIEGMKATSKN